MGCLCVCVVICGCVESEKHIDVELTSCLMSLWTVHLPIQQEQEQGI